MIDSPAYLDWNASAPLSSAAREAVLAALELTGNPSSVHAEGRAARRLVEQARAEVAALAGGTPEGVVFTSGATEAAATLLTPRWTMGRVPLCMSRLYLGATEHPCVLNGGQFRPEDITVIPVDRHGLLDLQDLAAGLAMHDRAGGVPLVAVQAANNETGVLQPIPTIAGIVRGAGGVLVVDGVQAAGRINIDPAADCGDFLILSSHKIGGPKGAGAIVSMLSVMMPLPLIPGGGQERGHRGGTENVAAIAGFGVAAREARLSAGQVRRLGELRDMIEEAVLSFAPDAIIHGAGAPRLPNTCFFAVPGLKAETMQIAFDLAGVAVSAGSACSSGKVGPSHVLRAMGFGEDASAVRVSVGLSTSEAEIERFRAALQAVLARRPFAARAA